MSYLSCNPYRDENCTPEECYEELAKVIVHSAYLEYVYALEGLLSLKEPNKSDRTKRRYKTLTHPRPNVARGFEAEDAKVLMNLKAEQCERFFHSAAYALFTSIPPRRLIKQAHIAAEKWMNGGEETSGKNSRTRNNSTEGEPHGNHKRPKRYKKKVRKESD